LLISRKIPREVGFASGWASSAVLVWRRSGRTADLLTTLRACHIHDRRSPPFALKNGVFGTTSRAKSHFHFRSASCPKRKWLCMIYMIIQLEFEADSRSGQFSDSRDSSGQSSISGLKRANPEPLIHGSFGRDMFCRKLQTLCVASRILITVHRVAAPSYSTTNLLRNPAEMPLCDSSSRFPDGEARAIL
jgi:hypothetical protein